MLKSVNNFFFSNFVLRVMFLLRESICMSVLISFRIGFVVGFVDVFFLCVGFVDVEEGSS